MSTSSKTSTKPLIVTFPSPRKFDEAYSTGLQYALLGRGLKAVHSPVLCKDFLSDVFWSEYTKKPASIYKFSWKPGKFNVQAEKYQLWLGFTEGPIDDRRTALRTFLNAWDSQRGYPATQVFKAAKGGLVVQFAKAWTEKPAYLSLFSLLIRVGLGYDGSDMFGYLERLTSAHNKYGKDDFMMIGDLLSRGSLKAMWAGAESTKEYAQYPDVRTFHYQSGILGYRP